MIYINGKKKAIKNIRNEIKYGATAADFALFFETTEESFLKALSDRVLQRYPGYKRELDKNKSKRDKMIRQQACGNQNQQVLAKDDDEVEDIMGFREEELEEKISTLKSEVETLDSENLLREKRVAGIDEKVPAVTDELIKLTELLKGHKNTLAELNAEKKSLKDQIEETTLSVEAKKKEIKEAEAELESCRIVYISYGMEGFKVSQNIFEPTREEIDEKIIDLSKFESIDEYALKYIRAAATIMCVVESLQIMEMKYVIEYEKCFTQVKEILNEVLNKTE